MDLKQGIQQAKVWCGQKRNMSGGLIADHSIDTAKQIEDAFKQTGEGDEKTVERLFLAALGHDLFEDTEVSREEVEKAWGKEVVMLIDGLTNLKGDNDFDQYIKNLAVADERIALVKYADILSNLNNSVERVSEIDHKWMITFWVPLLKRYEEELLPRSMVIFPKTGEYFVRQIVKGIEELETRVKV